MHARLIVVIAAILIMGCATSPKSNNSERNFNAPSLTVDLTSTDRQVIEAVPVESAMDYFEMVDSQGRTISYISFTDTATGALIFVDHKLHGTLSHHDAEAFYICRGHATSATSHWAHEATDWVDNLLASSKPATKVTLDFSGKSTVQSIKEVAESPFLKKIKSLLGMGSNPLNIFSSLSSARSDMEVSDRFDKARQGLNLIKPGMSESQVVEVMKPEDISFINGGIVMSYPSHLIEYYVTEGAVKVIQHPSFYFLAKTHATLFYAPKVQWPLCTPLRWKEALPETP